MNLQDLITQAETATRILGCITDPNFPARLASTKITETGHDHIVYKGYHGFSFRFVWTTDKVFAFIQGGDLKNPLLISTLHYSGIDKAMQLLISKRELAA